MKRAEYNELIEMLDKTSQPCPFKVGDVVECVEPDSDSYTKINKLGKRGIVHRIRQPDDRGWHGTEDMTILFKHLITSNEEPRIEWQIVCVRSWRFKLVNLAEMTE